MTAEALLVLTVFGLIGLSPAIACWLMGRADERQAQREARARWEDEAWASVMAGRPVRELANGANVSARSEIERLQRMLNAPPAPSADPFRDFVNRELDWPDECEGAP